MNELDALLDERVQSGDWLDAQNFPALRWTVEGVMPEGFGLIVAPPKAGKSWLVLGTALSKAAGTTALGCIRTKRAPVLYLALEDGYRRLQSRCRTLLGDGKKIPAGLFVIIHAEPHEVPLLIEQWLARHRDQAPLVIVDTLGKVMPPKAAGESDYQRDYRVAGRLKALADAVPGSTLLAVHHTRKAQGEDFIDSVSGTQGIAGAADFVLVLARKRQSTEASLSVTGRDVLEGEYAITQTDGAWSLDGDGLQSAADALTERRETANLSDDSVELVRFVNGRPAGTRVADVTSALDMNQGKARQYLKRAADTGRIGKAGRGLYTPVTSVTSVTNGEYPQVDAVSERDTERDSPSVGVTNGEGGSGLTNPNVTLVTDVTPHPGDACRVCGQAFLLPEPGKTVCARRDDAHDAARSAA